LALVGHFGLTLSPVLAFVYLGDKVGAGPDERKKPVLSSLCGRARRDQADPICGTSVKLIFSILISYPLAGVLKRVPDARPAYKNLFSLRCVVLSRGGRQSAMAIG
jgi:hypothetical protein